MYISILLSCYKFEMDLIRAVHCFLWGVLYREMQPQSSLLAKSRGEREKGLCASLLIYTLRPFLLSPLKIICLDSKDIVRALAVWHKQIFIICSINELY